MGRALAERLGGGGALLTAAAEAVAKVRRDDLAASIMMGWEWCTQPTGSSYQWRAS